MSRVANDLERPVPPVTVPIAAPPTTIGRRRQGLARRRPRRVLALVLAAVILLTGISYVRALTFPGSASWQMRSVEWVRDHGGSGLVDTVENWYYTRHSPPNAAPAASAVPVVTASMMAAAAVAGSAGGPPVLAPSPSGTLPGEDSWLPGRLDAAGDPSLYTTFYRPDPSHASIVTGAAWIRAGDTAGHLVAGTVEPGGGAGPQGAQIPRADVPALVATFNSGFKMKDIAGGYYADGRTVKPLANGQASLVIDDSGAITVGQWGRDVVMGPHVAAVRQNLELIVDGGHPVPGLGINANGRWGSSKSQHQYIWRSGIGQDRSGNLLYVAGNFLNLPTLAEAMAEAGVVRGMQLDIHYGMASFASWQPSGGSVGANPTKLLPDMQRPADRYLAPDQRDFVYLTLR